jgi:hypothetical protein
MVDNRNFQILLSASYYIIADCVSDTSLVDVEKLQDIYCNNTSLIKTMANNISEMYYTIKLRERERERENYSSLSFLKCWHSCTHSVAHIYAQASPPVSLCGVQRDSH